MMKRESGVNPEQTRCCKLRLRAEQTNLFATVPKGWEGVQTRE